jgi:hypothetical protein
MVAFDIEQEHEPLRRSKPTPSSTTNRSMFQRNYKWLVPLILGLFIATTLFFLSEDEAEFLPEDVTDKNGLATSSNNGGGVSSPTVKKKKPGLLSKLLGTPSPTFQPSPAPSNKPTPAPTTEPQNPLLNLNKMLQAFQEKRQKWLVQLETDYGPENLQRMLLDHGAAIRPPNETATDFSNDRLRRKLIIKILEAQQAARNQHFRNLRTDDSSSNTTADADADPAQDTQRNRRQADADSNNEFPKYVWATGGHSATASHGNFWRESYTAVMARGVQDIFAACGIDFVGRNYAMGGTSSGPEIAMCGKEVFGTDFDMLTWDTGMTDGGEKYKMLMYFIRAGIRPNQPAVVALHLGRRDRILPVQQAEDMGLAAFMMDDKEDKLIQNEIPDSFGLSDEEINKMPEFVRNFRCDKKVEGGDPHCGELKWNSTMCNGRKFRVSWHPGW